MSFSSWYREFRWELGRCLGFVPRGMDKESYREDFDEGMSPLERAKQEVEDLSR